MNLLNCLKGFIKKKKWVFILILVFALLCILKGIFNGNDIDGINTMIDVLIASTITAIIPLLVYYEKANEDAITRKAAACPYISICDKMKLNPTEIDNVDTIKLKVPIRTIKNDTGDKCELDDLTIKKELPFIDCTADFMIKSCSDANSIIDSLAFIVKNDDKIITKRPKKITAYRICYPEHDNYVEKSRYYKIKIDMFYADITEVQCKGEIGIVIKDTTPECNKYFIPIIDSFTKYTLGKILEISDISDLYFGKAPENIVHFFTHSSWKDY